MNASPPDPWTLVVTDVELDGPWPGIHSMRPFASVAVSADGTEHGRFEAVLEPLPGTAPDARTLEWFATQPEAWAAATTDPEPVPQVMERYVAWLQGLPWPRMFAAFPLALDGIWMDHYLRRFTPTASGRATTSRTGSSSVPTCACAATPRP